MDKILCMIWLVFLAITFKRGYSQCTWKNQTSFDRGPQKAVNSGGTISTYVNNTGSLTYSYVYWKWKGTGKTIMMSHCKLTCSYSNDSDSNEYASFSFGADDTSIITSLTFKKLPKEYDNQVVEASSTGCQVTEEAPFLLSVKYCQNTTIYAYNQSAKLSITSTLSEYGAISNCRCEDEKQEVFTVNGTHANTTVFCNDIANWQGCEVVQCWSAPAPVLEISNSSLSLEKNPYYANETIKLICAGDPGFPNFTEESTKYKIKFADGNSDTIESNLTVTPAHDAAVIWCEAANKYTSAVNTPSILSQKITINVSFPPMSSYLYRTQLVSAGDNVSLWFFFTSNPAVIQTELNLTFTDYNDTTASLSNNIMPVQDNGNGKEQNFTYKIVNVTKSNLGLYLLKVRSPEPYYKNSSLNMYVELTDIPYTTNAPENPSSTPVSFPLAAVIGGTTAGLLILVVIIVYFLVKFKRNKSSGAEKASDKEERDNPLYGTTARDGGAAVVYAADKTDGAGSSKEERLNPLYDSNSATQGGVEEAYAAVDVRKKKKKNKADKGNENAAFSSESNAAVYAAVDKSKKKKNDKPPVEAVYSEVNKKKGSKNDTALHGSSR